MTIAPWLSVTDATAAVAFYVAAFGAERGDGFEVDGVVEVAELIIDGASFWVQHDTDLASDAEPGSMVRMIVTVDDPDAAFARAVAAGGVEMAEVHDEHGWRTGRLRDPFGHQWELSRRIH